MFQIESMASTELCNIYGMKVHMYRKPREHEPPHIHIKYGDKEAEYELNGKYKIGSKDSYIKRLAIALTTKYGDILLDMWNTQDIQPLGITENDLNI